MALVALEIPKVGLVMENARLIRWLKQPGDVVQEGEPLLELETEKSVVEIESTASGRLVEILLQADQEARVGDRIAWLERESAGGEVAQAPGAGESTSATEAVRTLGSAESVGVAESAGTAEAVRAAGAVTAAEAIGRDQVVASAANVFAAHDASAATAASATVGPAVQSGRIKSSPVARCLAAENAINLALIDGTGPRGRVQLTDVKRAIESRSSVPHEPRVARPSSIAGVQPLSSMRRAVARSMALSNATVPQFNVERAVDWTSLNRVRARLPTGLPASAPEPSVNDFLLLAIARTLIKMPALNATFVGDADSPDAGVAAASGAHIGLVVAVEKGLLVPVLHRVERLGLVELARRRAEVVERALQGKLKREELEGATFSVSNLGARGPDRFNALINPSQSAILAVGRSRETVLAINGGVHVRPVSQLTLTVDHRVADGRLAADFLAAVVEALEGDDWHLD